MKYNKKKEIVLLMIFSACLIILISSLSHADQFSYQEKKLSVSSTDFTLSEVINYIGSASNKSITLIGTSIPDQKLNVRLQGESLDKGLSSVMLEAGVSNFSIGYDADKPENSSTIKIFITENPKASTQTTVNGYLNEKLGSHTGFLWEPDAVSLFEEAIKPIPANVKPWVLNILMSTIESESNKIHARKITKTIVADILKKYTPQKDQNYLNQQINPLLH